MHSIPQRLEDTISKPTALSRFVNVARYIFTNHSRRHTPAEYVDVVAFHVVWNRLNDLAIEYPDKKVLAIELHPYYPVVTALDPGKFHWSHGLFYRFVEWYLPLITSIPELKIVSTAHQNAKDYARDVEMAYKAIEEEFGLSELDSRKPEVIQEHWPKLIEKQLALFEDIAPHEYH